MRIVVIGAGVIGLTTALCARERDHEVVVVADRFAPDITSVVAGALWEWPPAVCGHHRDERSLERSKSWCLTSYRAFGRLAEDAGTGVYLRPAAFYFRAPVHDDPVAERKMRELREHVRGFRHCPSIAAEHGVSASAGVRDAYSYLAPMIDTDRYLAWLLARATAAGCRIRRERICGNLVDREQEILDRFGADLIINCAGLGARELLDDPVYPLRGALVHLRNDGRDMPRITTAHCMAYDHSVGGQNMVFIVPRGPDRLVLGGLVEPDHWDTAITMDNHPPILDMVRRCQEFLPILKDAAIDPETSVRVGLRPARTAGVRLEHQPGTRILHNFGHGGSGVTLSWGCAREVTRLIDRLHPAATTSGTPAALSGSPDLGFAPNPVDHPSSRQWGTQPPARSMPMRAACGARPMPRTGMPGAR